MTIFTLVSCSPHQRRIEDLLSREAEVNEHIQMSEDDVAQVNDLLSVLQDAKEVRAGQPLQLSRLHHN